jgi:hypothetical protein
VILQGDVPSPVNPPPGCRFHTRCWLYERLGKPENCRTIEPPLQVMTSDHRAACHWAAEALKTDVGISHLDQTMMRHGTPEAALDLIKTGEVKEVAEAAIAAAAPAADTGAPLN